MPEKGLHAVVGLYFLCY